MLVIHAAIVLAIASLLDYLIGDPWGWLHPVQVMGWSIHHYAQFVLKRWTHPLILRGAGVGLAIGLISLSGFLGWLIVRGATLLHPLLGITIESVLLASCLAGRSLRAATDDVLQPLKRGDLGTARVKLSLYVGRETENLSEAEILRAVLETATENAVDGVMAPLFYAIAGAILLMGSVPLALAYKASSTLDSMVGYRNPPYTELGWCSARLEDGFTWLPCRLTVLTLAILSGKPRQVWSLCQRDAPKDPSPNAGWSECAYAAALGVQVGGLNQYQGVPKHKPLLGEPNHPITCNTIAQALTLTRRSFMIWLSVGLVFLLTEALSLLQRGAF